jgi:hypothetical protein
MRARRAVTFATLVLLAVSCGARKQGEPRVSSEPVSVRGWVADVESAESANAPFRTVETEAARKQQLFQATSCFVDGAPFVSGGVVENGSFLLLDVPPGKVTITFQAPGAPAANLVLENIPGNADVYLPGLLLKKNGVTLVDPKNTKVRLAGGADKPTPTGQTAKIAGVAIPIMQTPTSDLADRHEWPVPPGSGTLATVK